MGVDDDMVDNPDQVVKDAGTALRKALVKAAKDASVQCNKPLPSVGEGERLTYMLNMP